MDIIKKIAAIILAAALCLGGAALAEETPDVTPEDFLDEWVDLDGTCNIGIAEHMNDEIVDGYVVSVHMPVIAEESYTYVTWAYGCVWDQETQTLKSISRVTGKGDYEPDSEEDITDINYEYSDAAFCFKDGMLIWDDKNETADDGLLFKRPIGWGEKYMPAEAAAFEGVWQCDRASISMYWEEEGFKVLITWGSSAWEHSEWEYSCFWHDEDHTLVSMPFGTRTEIVYDENGNLASATEAYNDGAAVFSLDEEGKLIWLDEKENAGEGMRFEKLPGEPAALSFATIGEAMDAEGYTGIAGGDDQHYVVVVEQDGAWIRLVADVDDEARRLGEETANYESAEKLEAAFNAYNEYIRTLPVAWEEEITAAPLTREELDALAGKTLQELEEAGYEHTSSEMGENDEATYTVSSGLYNYDLLLNETYTVYQQHDDSGYIGDLTVRSAAFAGLSHNAAELRYHADGTYDEENDPWAEYNSIMELISEAMSGENPEEGIRKLTEAMPEQAEEIRMFAEIFSSISDQDQESGFYTDEYPEAAAYYSTWVAEDGDWRIEAYDEDGGLKLMIVHKLGDNKEDIWEYAAALNPEKDALATVTVPLGLHYRQDTVSGSWDETYYEDGDAVFTLSDNGNLVWNDLKEDAGKGLEFMKIGNFFGGRWMKDDIEVIFYEWYDGQYDIRLYRRGENGEILDNAILKGDYDPAADTVQAEGCFDDGELFTVTFSYDESRNVVWTENGESTILEYSYYTD